MARKTIALIFSCLTMTAVTVCQMPVIPLPSPVPTMGHTGATFTDPAYGTTITQCTDPTTDPGNALHYSFEVTGGGANSQWVWSLDGTLLAVTKADTGNNELVRWNGTQCTLIPNTVMPAGTSASQSAPEKFYYIQTGTTQIWALDMSSGSPVRSQVGDFGTCLPAPNGGKWTWSAPVTTMQKDEAFFSGFSDRGLQDTGEYVVEWIPASNTCHVVNTMTSTLDGVPIPGAYTFNVHEVIASPGGWVNIGIAVNSCPSCPAGHGDYAWFAGTNILNLVALSGSGHGTDGYNVHWNLMDNPRLAKRFNFNVGQFAVINGNTGIVFPLPQDGHIGWQNVDALDLNPVMESQMSVAASGSTTPVPISVPLQDEIWMFDPTSGAITREGHCFSSGVANSFNFRTQYCIAAISPDGDWVAFSSDWMGALGNTVNLGQPCTLGAAKPNECQSQVFILGVK